MPYDPKPLDQMKDALRLKHRSSRTEEADLDWIERYLPFHPKHRSAWPNPIREDKEYSYFAPNSGFCQYALAHNK